MFHIDFFFWTSATFSVPAAGLSSRSRLRGTQGGRLYTRRKFGPRVGSVARALCVQSRAIWRVITGSLSVQPEPHKTMENPYFSLFAPPNPRSHSHGHYYACVDHYHAGVDIAYAYVCCVCYVCVRTCACVRAGLFIFVLEPRTSASFL